MEAFYTLQEIPDLGVDLALLPSIHELMPINSRRQINGDEITVHLQAHFSILSSSKVNK